MHYFEIYFTAPAVGYRVNDVCRSALKLLSTTAGFSNIVMVARVCHCMESISLPERETVIISEKFLCCSHSVDLIKRTQPSLLASFTPVSVAGDGNCLFPAVSVAAYGSEPYHMQLRAMSAIEAYTSCGLHVVKHLHVVLCQLITLCRYCQCVQSQVML